MKVSLNPWPGLYLRASEAAITHASRRALQAMPGTESLESHAVHQGYDLPLPQGRAEDGPDRLPTIWRQAPRRWGHKLHSLCSYMAMFPPTLPHVFIQWLTKPGDVVYDPFSGRGTTTLEACLQARVGLGSDGNPLAWILTSAKADPPTEAELRHRLSRLTASCREEDTQQAPESIRMLFDRVTLGQLLWLRGELSPRRRVDRFLLAALLGVLHANANRDGRPRGLTVAMPNTFAMAPRYIARYIRREALCPPRVDVVDFIAKRLARLPLPQGGFRRGWAWRQDVRDKLRLPRNAEAARLIFTSPPYLGVMRYAKLNWIRHWLLGSEPSDVDSGLFSSGSLSRYVDFMRVAVRRARAVLRDDGFVCLVIGDVRQEDREIRLAEVVAASCLQGTDLRVAAIVEDRLPVERKVSRIWGKTKGRATKADRILILAAARAQLPQELPAVSWSKGA
jgi:hypothetical protein